MWWNMKEWKKILRKILMLWYIKKEVWTLMLIRKVINNSKACAKCGNCQTNGRNRRKHMLKTHYTFSF